MGHKGWIVCSGLLWLCIGLWLTGKGLSLIAEGALGPDGAASVSARYFSTPRQGAMMLISLGLLIGFLKGRFVLSKTVGRVSMRIIQRPLPIRLKEVYSPFYLALLGSMMLLGMLLRIAPLALDTKGFIDLAVGSALVNGALLYFRAAKSVYST